jgi:bifunctional non-homologous end joining protein LigD
MEIQPMLAQDTAVLPEGPGWRFEPKYDGMRLFGIVSSGRARLFSREGNDKTRQFPEIAGALEGLHAAAGVSFVLDGELVAASSYGYSGFQALLSRVHLHRRHRARLLAELVPAAFVAFDVLVIGSTPLLTVPLEDRRRELVRLLRGRTGPHLRIALQGRNGARMLAHVVRRNLEGVVAKRADSPYAPGKRLAHWLKYKLKLRQEFVVAGFTESESREHLGALLLAYHDGGDLVYAGSVGSGFSVDMLAECRRRLDAIGPAFCPFEEVPAARGRVRWVRPEMVVEVTFEAWTKDGKIRNPRFAGFRADKPPSEVVRERQES